MTQIATVPCISDKLVFDVICQGKGSMTTYWLVGRRDGVIET